MCLGDAGSLVKQMRGSILVDEISGFGLYSPSMTSNDTRQDCGVWSVPVHCSSPENGNKNIQKQHLLSIEATKITS